jgi:thiaminase
METKALLKEIRSSLEPLNRKILGHPYISDAEKGTLSLGQIRAFVANQYYIVRGDAKSLALMLSRATIPDELRFFEKLAKSDLEALQHLLRMAGAFGFSSKSLEIYSPIAGAVAYTHYLTTLAQFASAGAQAIALTVNLPIWGANCRRLSKALREKFKLEETAFLDLSSRPTERIEAEALEILARYLPAAKKSAKQAARLLQAYELMFWDGIYEGQRV